MTFIKKTAAVLSTLLLTAFTSLIADDTNFAYFVFQNSPTNFPYCRVYYGPARGVYTNSVTVPNTIIKGPQVTFNPCGGSVLLQDVVKARVDNLPLGFPIFGKITLVDTNGAESIMIYDSDCGWPIPKRPSAPTQMTAK